ncbi:spore cortex biosynthesis protein YabQ [Amphibacillus sp. Q70]|uniref:spore cortex biosynthesis protein YabQ n=1 Tax=Amphibacillus sp. Q70 TaxID=3453416 RepID=UPI003F8465E7
MTIEIQFASFFSMLLVGIYLGCMFDTNERIIQMFQTKILPRFLFQFLFWLAQSLLIFYSLVKINGGQVRLYFILAIIGGFWFYFFSLRRLYQAILEKVIELFIQIFKLIGRTIHLLLIKPIVFFGQILLSLLNMVILILTYIFSFFFKIIKWVLGPIFRLIPENVKKYLVSLAGIYSKIENIVINRKKD